MWWTEWVLSSSFSQIQPVSVPGNSPKVTSWYPESHSYDAGFTMKSVNGIASKFLLAFNKTYLAAASLGVISVWEFNKKAQVIKAKMANNKGMMYLHQSKIVIPPKPDLEG